MIATVSTLPVPEATSWRRLFAVLVVVLGVALMHADSAAAQAMAPDQPMVMAGQDLGLMAPTAPNGPAAPADPCHMNGRACCVATAPSAAPRLLGLSLVAVLATTDPGQFPRLLAGPPFTSSPRGPPDLSALCVLRI